MARSCPTLCLHASELASLLGYNPYCDVAEATERVSMRLRGEDTSGAAILARAAERGEVDTGTLATMASAETRAELKRAKKSGKGVKRAVEKAAREVSATIAAAPDETAGVTSDAVREVLGDVAAAHVCGDAAKARGTAAEARDLDRLSDRLERKVVGRNTSTYVKTLLMDKEHRVILAGKVDGLTEDGDIVETKHRQRRLFFSVPVREVVQCHCYMYLLGKDRAFHVQNFGGESQTEEIAFDGALWGEIMERVGVWVRAFYA